MGHFEGLYAQGASFRRETPIGAFIADFAWLSRRLVIEVDGDSHETIEGKKRDALKDAFLTERGFVTMRFDNHQVTDGPDYVTMEIETFLKTN